MIEAIIVLSLGVYTSITMILLMFMDVLLQLNKSEYGVLKLFGWPVYFPLWIICKILLVIKEIIMFLYCDVFIRSLDKLFGKK